MILFARTDRSVLGRWWWTVDHWTLGALVGLLVIGVVLIGSGSPGVSSTIGLDPFHFFGRHMLFVPVAVTVLFVGSLMAPKDVRLAALALYAGSILMLVAVLVFGQEVKGATRWFSLLGFSLQPSEFMKPALAVLSAWLFVEFQATRNWLYLGLNILALGLALALIASQPDIGMTAVIAVVWGIQFFLLGHAGAHHRCFGWTGDWRVRWCLSFAAPRRKPGGPIHQPGRWRHLSGRYVDRSLS